MRAQPKSAVGGFIRCKATWKREFKFAWCEAGPPNHHDDKVDSDQLVVNNELSLCAQPKSAVGGFIRPMQQKELDQSQQVHRAYII